MGKKKQQKKGVSDEVTRSKLLDRRHIKMHGAIKKLDFDAIRLLLGTGETFCTKEGLNCFILAASLSGQSESSRWSLVHRMLSTDPQSGLQAKNEDGSTLLMIFSNCQEKIQLLVDLGADVDAVDKANNSVLMRSYKHSKADAQAFLRLLEFGANPNVPTGHRYPNIISFMLAKRKHCSNDSSVLSFKHLMQPEFFSKLDSTQFEENPIFDCLDFCCHLNQNSYRMLELGELLRDTDFSPFGPMLTTRKTSLVSQETPEWTLLKEATSVPEKVLLDPQSFLLLNLKLDKIRGDGTSNLKGLLDSIQGYVAVNNTEVLPPALALLYNLIQLSGFGPPPIHQLSHELESDPLDIPLPPGLLVANGHGLDPMRAYDEHREQFRCTHYFLKDFCIEDETFRLSGSWLEVVVWLGPVLSNMSSQDISKFVEDLIFQIPENPLDVLNQILVNMRLLISRSEQMQRYLENFCDWPLRYMMEIILGPDCTLRPDKILHNDLDEKILSKAEEILEGEGENVRGKVQALEALSLWAVRKRLFKCRKEGQGLGDCIAELVETSQLPQSLQNDLMLFK
ncbi:uncharacterized protein LOC132203816 [Neocloeon triangulifer]|uniref:uncharacterized protein LOC132203816 n=1 Tax=Neocloeon triangulifer TaxID=2078957 RepID=UPI00286EBF1E|nr:uncharacterized protein LOC132203816 [Neocloeon triangulifer]